MTTRLKVFFGLLTLLILFTHFWNIDYTARFTRDESSDLARMHSYWKDKKIALVGPISSDNVKVFSSLTYYMQLPFAAMWNFEPVGPAIGTAFWGVLTVALLIAFLFLVKGNKPLGTTAYLFFVVAAIWTPLLLTSRWAWNPHLVPFWIALALVVYNTKWKFRFVLTGLFMGLSFHHHYIAIFAIGTFGLIASILLFRARQYVQIGMLVSGYVLALLPFVLFDLRHPPGLFLTSYLQSNTSNIEGITTATLLPKLWRNISISLGEISAGLILQITWLVGAVALFWSDLKTNKRYLLYSLPVIAQILGPVVVDGYSQRYFLPSAIFLLAWLALPRGPKTTRITIGMLVIMIISSVWLLPSVLTKPIMSPPLTVVTQAQHAVMQILTENPEIKNANIATLTGSDADSLADKYRDLLSVRGISFRAASEYDASEHLLVITTENESNVRNDQNVSMQIFRDTTLRGHVYLDEEPWQVYWFSY